jgi:hypothetical protein
MTVPFLVSIILTSIELFIVRAEYLGDLDSVPERIMDDESGAIVNGWLIPHLNTLRFQIPAHPLEIRHLDTQVLAGRIRPETVLSEHMKLVAIVSEPEPNEPGLIERLWRRNLFQPEKLAIETTRVVVRARGHRNAAMLQSLESEHGYRSFHVE